MWSRLQPSASKSVPASCWKPPPHPCQLSTTCEERWDLSASLAHAEKTNTWSLAAGPGATVYAGECWGTAARCWWEEHRGRVHSSLQLLGCPAEGLPAIVGGAGAVTVPSWRPTLCHLAHCQTPSSNGSVWLVTGAQWLFADDTNRWAVFFPVPQVRDVWAVEDSGGQEAGECCLRQSETPPNVKRCYRRVTKII